MSLETQLLVGIFGFVVFILVISGLLAWVGSNQRKKQMKAIADLEIANHENDEPKA